MKRYQYHYFDGNTTILDIITDSLIQDIRTLKGSKIEEGAEKGFTGVYPAHTNKDNSFR